MIGATYSLKGEFDQADDYLLKSLQIDPGFVPARKNLAISYFNSGKYDLAATEFQRLMNEPGDLRSVALLFLGIIAEEQERLQQVRFAPGTIRGGCLSVSASAAIVGALSF